MKDDYFIELNDLVAESQVDARIQASLRELAQEWILSDTIIDCLLYPEFEQDVPFTYMVFTPRYVYLASVTPDILQKKFNLQSIKGFKASDMVAHAFIMGNELTPPEIRLMMSEGKRIKVNLDMSTINHDANIALMKRLATSNFFTGA